MSELAKAPDLRPVVADLIGKPYKLGTNGPYFFDCYGLIETLYARSGVPAPGYERPQLIKDVVTSFEGNKHTWVQCEPGSGAVVAFRLPGSSEIAHVGFVLPHGKFIHVWERSGGVCIERLDAWRHRIVGYYTYVGA